MIYKWKGFRFPPRDKKMDKAIIMLIVLLFLLWSTGGCSYTVKPYQTKIGYETNTSDKENSDNDTKKTGWNIEQIFKWEDKE